MKKCIKCNEPKSSTSFASPNICYECKAKRERARYAKKKQEQLIPKENMNHVASMKW